MYHQKVICDRTIGEPTSPALRFPYIVLKDGRHMNKFVFYNIVPDLVLKQSTSRKPRGRFHLRRPVHVSQNTQPIYQESLLDLIHCQPRR